MPLLGCASCYCYATAAMTGLSRVVTPRARKAFFVTGRNAWTGVEQIQKRAESLRAAAAQQPTAASLIFAFRRNRHLDCRDSLTFHPLKPTLTRFEN